MSDPKQITLAHGAVKAKLIGADRETLLKAQELLSYKVDGSERSTGFGGRWDGRSSFFEFASAMFPAGFVRTVHAMLLKDGHRVNVISKPLPEPLGPSRPVVDSFAPDPRYTYQDTTVDTLLKRGKMIAQCATGSGKSRIAKLAHCRIARKTLFLTTRGILMHQMRKAFEKDLGKPVSVYGDSDWSATTEDFSVGMVQTFAARLSETTFKDELLNLQIARERRIDKKITAHRKALVKEKVEKADIDARCDLLAAALSAAETSDADLELDAAKRYRAQIIRRNEAIDLLAQFDFVIGEEAHEVSSNSFTAVMEHCTNAHYRLALTATPFMKDSEEANMRLLAAFGPVGVVVSEKNLIDLGILAKPYFKTVAIADPNPDGYVFDERIDGFRVMKLMRTHPYARAYEVGIVGGIKRNAAIVTEVKRAAEHALSSMVLVQHTAHGKRLAALLDAAGVKCAFISGECDQTERDAAISALKSGQINCLIGSTILDVGVDVPAVGLVVLAGGGKAEVAFRQRVGRGLRAKGQGVPNVCFILDFSDPVNASLLSHALERRRMVEQTPGFFEGICADFPYSLFANADSVGKNAAVT